MLKKKPKGRVGRPASVPGLSSAKVGTERKNKGKELYESQVEEVEEEELDNVVFRPNPGPQSQFLSAPEQEVLFGGAAGGGKLVKKGDKLLTPIGFKAIEDMAVGDVVNTVNGGVQKVTYLHPWTKLPKWTVKFSDGTDLDVAEDHLWFAWKARSGRKINGVRVFGEASGKVVETKIIKDWLDKGYKPQIPLVKEQYFYPKDVPFDPYLLGVLIGDGCLTSNDVTITCSENDKEHYKNYIKSDRWETHNTIRFIGKQRKQLVEDLKNLGLFGTRSCNKFIPDIYKINSIDVRWAVTQGLMDTDGYSAPDKNAIYYYTVSEKLANDAAFLFRSLGACVTVTNKIGTYRDVNGEKVECKKVYNLYIKHSNPDKFFRMRRKKHGKFGKALNQKAIIDVAVNGEVEGRCITVSGQDSLYVTNNFTVTHNSYGLLADAVRYIMYPDYTALILRRTSDELRELIQKSQELYTQIDRNARWQEKKSEWKFGSGARIWFTYLDRDEDVHRYQGQAFAYIAFDELTHYPTRYPWDYLRSRLRTTNPYITPYMRACVDEGEVLTEDGWKDIKEVREGELVYSVSSDGELVKRKVTGVFRYYNTRGLNCNLIEIKKKNLYMSMTPDHRVVYKKHGKVTNNLIRFNEHKGKSINIVRTPSKYNSNGYKSPIGNFDDGQYCSFLGWYVAEGCINTNVSKGNYKVIITQLKEENHEEVRSVMESGGYNVCYSKNGDFQINDKELRQHLLPLGKSHEKHFPREFLDKASVDQIKLAFYAYMKGDGHFQSPKSASASTVSKQLKDDLLEMAVKMGVKAQAKKYVSENEKHRDKYVVYFSWRGDTTKVDIGDKRYDVKEKPFDGYVYCLGVEETENFIIKQNDCVWVSGNTTNPGGVGHQWVKSMFVDPAPPGKAFWATDVDTGEILRYPELDLQGRPHPKAGQPLFRRRFIPALLKDNPYLANTGYEASLLSLPEDRRRALLEGDWSVTEGAAFREFRRALHVCKPFEIPSGWRIFRAADYGYGSHSAVLWFAVAPSGQIFVVDELYVSKVLAVDLARMVMEKDRKWKSEYGILDSSLWHKRGDMGPSIAEAMIGEGCKWRPSDRSKGSRVAGKQEIHRLLAIDDFLNEPKLLFFENCTNVIAHLPTLPLDKNNIEDIDSKVAFDHTYDALRYGVMSRPKSKNIFEFGNDTSNNYGYNPVDSTFGY